MIHPIESSPPWNNHAWDQDELWTESGDSEQETARFSSKALKIRQCIEVNCRVPEGRRQGPWGGGGGGGGGGGPGWGGGGVVGG